MDVPKEDIPGNAVDPEDDLSSRPATPSTVTILAAGLCVALLFAWLGVYALTNALASAELIKPFTADHDPRLTWLGISVAFILTLQLAAFVTLRHISQRHKNIIEALDHEDEDNKPTFIPPPKQRDAA